MQALKRRSIHVMPGLAPGIHVFLAARQEDVDGRDEPGHDERIWLSPTKKTGPNGPVSSIPI